MPASAAEPLRLTDQDRADLNCLAAVSVALGRVATGGKSTKESEGMASVVTYFFGKLKGRHPDLRIADVLTADSYISIAPIMDDEFQRCRAEAIEMGLELQATGKAISAASEAMPGSGN